MGVALTALQAQAQVSAAEKLAQEKLEAIIGGVKQVAEFFFELLQTAPKRTGAPLLIRDLIETGTIPPEKQAILEAMRPRDVERLLVKISEWVREIQNPGTGQPIFALAGILPREIPLLDAKVRQFRSFRAGSLIGSMGEIGDIVRLPNGEALLVLASGGRSPSRQSGGLTDPRSVERFQARAAELRQRAERRGLI